MVSQGSPSNSASSILHQFIVSNSISNQNHFYNEQFHTYETSSRPNNNTFHHHPSHDTFSAINQAHERLSLSLGSHMLVPSNPFDPNLIHHNYSISNEESNDYSYASSSYGVDFLSTFVGNSRFLKPTQALLEEIVNGGGKNIDLSYEKYIGRFSYGSRNALELSSELKELCNNGFFNNHELQLKISKLVSLLEEVENRYAKYYNQLEEVASSFEVIAGLGSSKTYTCLALQAMSRHFCNLRDAILAQINKTKRKLSQDLPKISTGLSKLSLFDQENKNNRISLQQLGLIQSQRQAWRPIRGLPETSVSILRSWLFEHFLHPYPNDSEKLMLASQTGLSKNQVSNWFINARVRLWKPMIEEMYKEEFADCSMEDAAMENSDD